MERMVRCVEAPGESAKWNTVGKYYPVREVNEALQEFLSEDDSGNRCWFKMRRFDFQQSEAEA